MSSVQSNEHTAHCIATRGFIWDQKRKYRVWRNNVFTYRTYRGTCTHTDTDLYTDNNANLYTDKNRDLNTDNDRDLNNGNDRDLYTEWRGLINRWWGLKHW
jgi:hypothetical protein